MSPHSFRSARFHANRAQSSSLKPSPTNLSPNPKDLVSSTTAAAAFNTSMKSEHASGTTKMLKTLKPAHSFFVQRRDE